MKRQESTYSVNTFLLECPGNKSEIHLRIFSEKSSVTMANSCQGSGFTAFPCTISQIENGHHELLFFVSRGGKILIAPDMLSAKALNSTYGQFSVSKFVCGTG